MRHSPRFNDETQRFEIVTFDDLRAPGTNGPDDPGESVLAATLHVFPPGTTNETCCAEYDHWAAAGTLTDGSPLNGGQ